MDERNDIELALLEGMDETLLARLHEAGIRTRSELGSRISNAPARHRLAQEVGVSPRRLRILNYLNFLLPEERAERTLKLEHRVETHIESTRQDIRRLWRLAAGLALAVAALVAVLVFLRPGSSPAPAQAPANPRLDRLEVQMEALRPLGIAHARSRILDGVKRLGPAPGWTGPWQWTSEDDDGATVLLGEGEAQLPPRALSLALAQLSVLENAPVDSVSPQDRAREAARILTEFPAPSEVTTAWDAAAVLVRQRFRSRAGGLVPLRLETPTLRAAALWSWTSPGFLSAEELLARAESLPVEDDALTAWSELLVQLRTVADQAQTDLGDRPEAWARDYWIRRGEMEVAVVGAFLGRSNLLPYHTKSPREFLRQRKRFLENAMERAPALAHAPLAWLRVEYEEALQLEDWARAHPLERAQAQNRTWMEALSVIETARGAGPGPGAAVTEAVARAARLSGAGGDPFSSPRTRWEAGLRPLLMETRAAVKKARPPETASP